MQTATSTPGKPSSAGNRVDELVARLTRLGRTVATAESCTGGLLAGAITGVPGASKVFPGGVVSYADETKAALLGVPECLLRQHGAVSAEVAAAMAAAVAEKCGADYGLATTGFAGPDGGTEKDPAGTVYLGFHTPDGLWAIRESFAGNREEVRAQAVAAVMAGLIETLGGRDIS